MFQRSRPLWHGALLTATGMLLAACAGQPAPPSGSVSPQARTAGAPGTATLSRAEYLDKTLAGLIGEVGGFLSGYEFSAPNPYPHPDDWFEPMNGPYAGNFSHFTPPGDTGTYVRYLGAGRVRGQDNYFMDLFNQRVLEEKGLSFTDADLRAAYLHYGISDYGGSGVAERLMTVAGMLPFQTGQHEFNDAAWCCEPYLETDTLGFIAPGMPQSARDLARRLATVSGTFDTTVWSEFMATLMSVAYFETDARVALHKAAATLPANSWPRQIYEQVVALHARHPGDWRAAQAELLGVRRFLYGSDDDRVIADINQGLIMLAILYGDNDYLRTLQIASIGGNEGVDNATPVGGLMGVIKGMAGTPRVFKDRIYANGAGVFVNDNSGALQTYVRRNYPAEQKWSDLAALYARNFERLLRQNGGGVTAQGYTVPLQRLESPSVLPLANGDFETGTLSGWTLSAPGNGLAETQTGVYNPWTTWNLSYSGRWKGTLFTGGNVRDVRLTRVVNGLTPGRRYRARAYVESMSGANAAFYVQVGGSVRSAAAHSTEDMGSSGQLVKGRAWAQRNIEFVAGGDSVTLGYRLQSETGAWAAIDDVTVEEITKTDATRHEAESATLSGGAGVQSAGSASGGQYVTGLNSPGAGATFALSAPAAGEYRLAVNYANPAPPEPYNLYGSPTWALPASLTLVVNGVTQGKVYFPRTGFGGQFSQNVVNIPVTLGAGANTVTLRRDEGAGGIDLDFAELSAAPRPVYVGAAVNATSPAATNLALNAGFEVAVPAQTPQGWGTWCGRTGNDCDADYVEGGGHSGGWRLTHHKDTPYEVYTDQSFTDLPNGTYTLSAWVVGGGGQNAAFMSVKNFGGDEVVRGLPQSGWPNWTRVEIPGIQVTNGRATVGFYSDANAGQWLSVDDVEFVRQ